MIRVHSDLRFDRVDRIRLARVEGIVRRLEERVKNRRAQDAPDGMTSYLLAEAAALRWMLAVVLFEDHERPLSTILRDVRAGRRAAWRSPAVKD